MAHDDVQADVAADGPGDGVAGRRDTGRGRPPDRGEIDGATARLGRRGALRAGLVAGGALLSGCNGLPTPFGDDGSASPYRNWLPAPEGATDGGGGDENRVRAGSRLVAYADLAGLSAVASAAPDYGAFGYRDLLRSRDSADRGALGVDPLLAAGDALAILRFEVRFGARPYPFADALLRGGHQATGTGSPSRGPGGREPPAAAVTTERYRYEIMIQITSNSIVVTD